MEAAMSVATRKELLKHVKGRYKKANWKEKSKILDEFCTLTSYGRKYAINLFNSTEINFDVTKTENRYKKKKYDEFMANELKNKFNKTSSFLKGFKNKTADIT